MKLKKGDEVKVIKGKDKGKTGKIEKAFPKDKKVLISNINLYKRHLKARSETQPSEIATLTKPLALENVILVCPKCHKTTRVGYKLQKNLPRGKAGVKVRICRKCKSEI